MDAEHKAAVSRLITAFGQFRQQLDLVKQRVRQQRPTFYFYNAVDSDTERLASSLRSLQIAEEADPGK
jgi:hypothetical protein